MHDLKIAVVFINLNFNDTKKNTRDDPILLAASANAMYFLSPAVYALTTTYEGKQVGPLGT